MTNEPQTNDGYATTIKAIQLMATSAPMAPGRVHYFMQGGLHGYSLCILEAHLDYLRRLNALIELKLPVFDKTLVHRWKTLNDLLINTYRPEGEIPEQLVSEFPTFAALLGFPLLEEVARRISRAWDEEGRLLVDIPETIGLTRIDSKGKVQAKDYKKGHRIVDLSHKLYLMKSVLDADVQRGFDEVDATMKTPLLDTDGEMAPVFERLAYFRDMWSHGRRYDGIEAILITHFLALLYFGQSSGA